MDALFDAVYLSMLGESRAPLPGVRDMFFEGGACALAYERAMAARERITLALTGEIGDEQRDVLELIAAYEVMQQELCRAAFQHGGRLAAQKTEQ